MEIFTIWIFREKSLLTVLYATGTLLRCVYHEFSQQRVESRSMTDLTDTSVHVGSATCYRMTLQGELTLRASASSSAT